MVRLSGSAGRSLLLGIVLPALAMTVGVGAAEACSCVRPQSPCASMKSSQTIFVGRVVSATTAPDQQTIRVRFEVEEQFTGRTANAIDLTTPSTDGMCGFPFRVGTKYLVYAHPSSEGLTASQCSRTRQLVAAGDDLSLLRQTAAGTIQSRLSGAILEERLDLDGFYMHNHLIGGVPNVPITVRGGGREYQARTDQTGQFTLLGLPRGKYEIDPQLPAPYGSPFGRTEPVDVDECFGEAFIFVARMTLTGETRAADGTSTGKDLMLRVARLDANNQVTFDQTTLAFTTEGGRWRLPGLPPGRYVLGINIWDSPTPQTPYPAIWYPASPTVSGATVITVRDDQPQQIVFTMPVALRKVPIRGRVIDEAGNGVAKASVLLYDDATYVGPRWTSHVAYVQTDDQGGFTITGLAGRSYHLEAESRWPADPPQKSDRIPVDMNAASPSVTITVKKR